MANAWDRFEARRYAQWGGLHIDDADEKHHEYDHPVNLFNIEFDPDYRENWTQVHAPRLFHNPGLSSKIWYKSPYTARQLLTPAGKERYPTLAPLGHSHTTITPYNQEDMSVPMLNLYTFMGSFNKTQRGEVVEAFGHTLLYNYLPHGNDDYLVDGYLQGTKVNESKINRRMGQLRFMTKNGRNLLAVGRRMAELWDANLHGVFEPRHEHMDCVPVEIKCRSTDRGTNSPSLGQAIYLWIYQGILMHVAKVGTGLVVKKTDFSDVTGQEFLNYVTNFI